MYKITRRNFLQSSAALAAGLSLGLSGCGGSGGSQKTSRFAVLSDPHIYDTSLGTDGEAFLTYIASDRKMLVQSAEILEAIVAELLDVEGLEFVLVPGDLTKDGEKVCHEKFNSIMTPLLDNGIDVYVVPGNHDVNNPHAVSFSGGTTIPVAQVTPEEFAEIHKDFGYSRAKYKDPDSLSYVAEVAENVWLIAIDSCKYDDNATSPDTSGEISSATLSWILDKLSKARHSGIKVFGMAHHGMTSHFAAQTTFFPEYVLDDYMTVGELLVNAGLDLFFTGHFHAQDIVRADFSGGSLYDIETGSSVTAPCPYRVIDFDIVNKALDITSSEVHSIPSVADFDTYKADFISTGMLGIYQAALPAMGISADVAPAVSEIHIAHYKGDEQGYTSLSATSVAIIQSMLASTDPDTLQLAYALVDWASDSSMADNNTDISF